MDTWIMNAILGLHNVFIIQQCQIKKG